jgi:hypothetical protein
MSLPWMLAATVTHPAAIPGYVAHTAPPPTPPSPALLPLDWISVVGQIVPIADDAPPGRLQERGRHLAFLSAFGHDDKDSDQHTG